MARQGSGVVAGLAVAVILEAVAVVGFTAVRDRTATAAEVTAIFSERILFLSDKVWVCGGIENRGKQRVSGF